MTGELQEWGGGSQTRKMNVAFCRILESHACHRQHEVAAELRVELDPQHSAVSKAALSTIVSTERVLLSHGIAMLRALLFLAALALLT